ncbi:F-box domain-containing protein 11 [Elsinoe australis]|uniref:F-box domain-containing protein 11 n=1 Tax=Elsinoe australis TaxID=40998 RepID=A0A4U7AL62_9PEZI|nr:F-box domain-containing protein 11 [Elsinoe australis]
MSSFLRLPPEVIFNVLARLDLPTHKTVRLVSKSAASLAAKFVFKEILFNFDVDGLDHIIAVSQHAHLASCVRTIVLHCKKAMFYLGSFEVWRMKTVYEHNTVLPEREVSIDAGMMSPEEWRNIGLDIKQRLYDRYEQERRTRTRHATALATATSMTLNGDTSSAGDVLPEVTEARWRLERFQAAVNSFPSLIKFHHCSFIESSQPRWRNVQFYPTAHAGGNKSEIREAEALYLFLSLRQCLLSMPEIRSMVVTTSGPMIFNELDVDNLLLCSLDQDGQRKTAAKFPWINRKGPGYASRRVDHPATHRLLDVRRTLLAMGKAFTKVHSLVYRLKLFDCSGDGMIALAEAVSTILKQGTSLERLCLVFGTMRLPRYRNWSIIDDEEDSEAEHATEEEEDGNENEEEVAEDEDSEGRSLGRQSNSDTEVDGVRYASYRRDTHDNSYAAQMYNFVYRSGAFRNAGLVHRTLSQYLLLAPIQSNSLRQLRHLSLSIVTTERHLTALFSALGALRHLVLDHVVFIPMEGCWESAFTHMASDLRLQAVELSALGDCVLSPRVIMHQYADLWRSSRRGRTEYARQKNAIVKYVLGQTDHLPPLDPAEYFRAGKIRYLVR